MNKLTSEQIKALAPYDLKLRRALTGGNLNLTSVAVRTIKNIYREVFGRTPSFCGGCGGRSIATQIAPLAKLYVEAVDYVAPEEVDVPAVVKRGRRKKAIEE